MGKRSNKTKRNRTTSSSSLLPPPTQQPQPASFESLPEVLHSTIAPYLKQDETPYPDIGLLNLIAAARWLAQHYESCIIHLKTSKRQEHPALLSLLVRLPALETLKLLSFDNNELTTVATALRAGACASLTRLEFKASGETRGGVMDILRALGSGSCPSLHQLAILGLDVLGTVYSEPPSCNDLEVAEAEEIVLALADALEERQAIGCAGFRRLDIGAIWEGDCADASSCIIPLVAPTLEVATLWCYDVFTDFSATVQQHPGPVLLKDLHCQPGVGYGDYDFLPLARAMKEGKIPHLQSLELEFISLCGQAVGCLIDALEGGSLKMLETLDLTQVGLDDDGFARLFQALGNGAQHTQHVVRLSIEADDDDQDMLGTQAIQALGWALQQCGACPNLKELLLGGRNLGCSGDIGLRSLLGTSLATPRLYEKLVYLRLGDGALTSDSMKLLAQFMASRGLPDLRDLRLFGNPGIGSDGMQQLVTGLRSCHFLESLNLTSCSIDDAGLRCLAHACAEGSLNSLREALLRYIAVSDDVKEECGQLMKKHGVTVIFD